MSSIQQTLTTRVVDLSAIFAYMKPWNKACKRDVESYKNCCVQTHIAMVPGAFWPRSHASIGTTSIEGVHMLRCLTTSWSHQRQFSQGFLAFAAQIKRLKHRFHTSIQQKFSRFLTSEFWDRQRPCTARSRCARTKPLKTRKFGRIGIAS